MDITTYAVDGRDFELQHYGVKGMKWGKRKPRSYYADQARTSRESAREWDEMAKYAEQRGNAKKAAKYRANAAKDRADAKAYERQAGPKKSTKTSSPKQKVSTGKKSVQKSMKKLAGSTVRSAAKTASIGSQMVLRMMQNQVTYTTAGNVFDSIYNR